MKDRYAELKEAFQDSQSLRYLSVADARENVKRILTALDPYQGRMELFSLSRQDLSEILYENEMLSASIRKAMAAESERKLLFIDKEKKEGTLVKERDFLEENNLRFAKQIEEKKKEYFGENGIQIDVDFDEKTLSVYSPLTFKRAYRKSNFICNYLLANQIEEALRQYEKDNKISFYKMTEPPYVCVMIRKNYRFSINAVCDGDNLENQKIINTLSKALSIPDNGENMELYSKWQKARPDEKEGMYFKIMSKKNLLSYLQETADQ